MTRILIADDHAVVRAGLRQFLEEDRTIREIGEASTGTETLDQLRAKPWDLLILDIYMPDRSGLDILKQVQRGYPNVKILIISGLPERQYALNALKAGASGYLAKDSAPDELLKAVRAVLRGRRYVSGTLAELLVSDLNHEGEEPLHARLSEREFQIFCKLASGRSVSEIADELFLSVKTVSTYRSRVLEKMSFSTNADLTLYAFRNGMIQ
jgi:two-component system, NarL family, invasion response regulator UvrY